MILFCVLFLRNGQEAMQAGQENRFYGVWKKKCLTGGQIQMPAIGKLNQTGFKTGEHSKTTDKIERVFFDVF